MVPYETESVSVSAAAADYKAGVRFEGGQELVAGADTEIKVICTAEDGTEKVYTIIIKRAAAQGSTEPAPETTVPTTVPETTAPTTVPGTTQAPSNQGNPSNSGGIQVWVLIIVSIAFLMAGAFVGILVGKKMQVK